MCGEFVMIHLTKMTDWSVKYIKVRFLIMPENGADSKN